MGLHEKGASLKTFATVISDGSIRVQAEENEPGAVCREYEKPDKTKGHKWEKVYASLDGLINSIKFKDTDYGKFLDVEIDGIVLSLGTNSNFCQDLMKKLPNVKLDEVVLVVPYSFEGDNGKPMRGITVYQGGEKIKSAFWDNEAKQVLHDFPTVSKEESERYQKDDWKIFFIGVKKFLVDYTEKNVIPNIKTSDEQFRENLDKAGIGYAPMPEEEPQEEQEILNIPF
jgi:hypothetical protein